ncbi:MAG: MliC family protein [Candidatus Pacebacteria bacterium]|nr:MliC family protein [Candidatus Paceibacterota bacterium]
MNNSRKGMWALIIIVILVIIVLLLILAANGTSSLPPTTTQTQTTASTTGATSQSIEAKYSCDAGKTIDATYLNASTATTTGNSVQLVLSDGRQMTLAQTLSADGARYSNGNPQIATGKPGAETFIFWSKGNGAFIEENGTTTFNNCVVQSQQ